MQRENQSLFKQIKSLFKRITKQEGAKNFFSECFSWEIRNFPEVLKKINAENVFKFFNKKPNATVEEFNAEFVL